MDKNKVMEFKIGVLFDKLENLDTSIYREINTLYELVSDIDKRFYKLEQYIKKERKNFMCNVCKGTGIVWG